MQIVNYDARKITPEMRTKVERLLQSKGNSFEQQVRQPLLVLTGAHARHGSAWPLPPGAERAPCASVVVAVHLQVIYRVSVAAAPLAAWVKANMAYSKVLEKVAPLEAELSGLVASLQQSGQLIAQVSRAHFDGGEVTRTRVLRLNAHAFAV